MRKTLLIFILLLAIAAATFLFMEKNKLADMPTGDAAQGEGTALIGGDFTLTNQDGALVTNRDFQGRVMLVFFGFTHCPDICPVTSATFARLLEILGDKTSQVAPIFISVDPARDTPEVLKNYFANIDPRIIGLTGTPEQTAQAAQAYKAYFSTATAPAHDEHDSQGHGHDTTDYMVDHSGFIYVMDKNGAYAKHFPFDASAETIAAAVTPLLD